MDDYTDAYHCTIDQAAENLQKYGIAVVLDVIPRNEYKAIVDTLWENMAYVTRKWGAPISRDDQTTWNLDDFTFTGGLIGQHHHVGHWQAAWDVRQHPSIVSVFAKLWDVKPTQLLASFDGISISFPPEVTGKGWQRELNLHCDTSFYYGEKQGVKNCIQGWFTPIAVRPGDATLNFYTYSHLFHRKFGQKFELTDKKDWYKLTEEQKEYYLEKYGCTHERIMCPAGSLVLWDSRVIHCGQKPLKGREKPNFRFCFYVCMMPRSMATESRITAKQKAFEELRLTSHNPLQSKLFSKEPYVRGDKSALQPITKPKPPVLTKLGLKLAGF